MMTELQFYEGARLVGAGRWSYIPRDGMTLRLELPGGARLFRVFSSEGVGMVRGGEVRGGVPTLLERGVRVQVGDITDLAELTAPPPAVGQ